MKAIVITKPGGPEVLTLMDRPDPVANGSEVLVRVRATALNRADLLQRMGRYPAPAGVSADIPGLEFAGEVESIGEGVTQWKHGDRVMGLLGGGGYAEKIVSHERTIMRIPERMSFEDAAAIPEVFLTAYDAVFLQLNLQMGERLLVHAVASGVGTAALQLAKVAGATVVGTSRSADKFERVRALALDLEVLAGENGFADGVRKATGGAGVQAVLDLVGASYWEQNLAVLAPRGRIILVGMVGGSKVQTDLRAILGKRLHVIGTVLRARELEEKMTLTQLFAERILPLFDNGRLKPIVERVFPLAEAAKAHELMEQNRNVGKIVLSV